MTILGVVLAGGEVEEQRINGNYNGRKLIVYTETHPDYNGQQSQTTIDINSSGEEEVILENNSLALFFDPSGGGVLKELDHKKIAQNFINTLSRKKEAYHRKMLRKIEEENSPDNEGVKTIHDAVEVTEKSPKDHLIYDA